MKVASGRLRVIGTGLGAQDESRGGKSSSCQPVRRAGEPVVEEQTGQDRGENGHQAVEGGRDTHELALFLA